MSENTEKLSLWQKIGYGIGDIFGGGSGTLIGFYYLYFLTDVVRLNPGLAGSVILISKIYDAITDPFEGILADRTRTRLGRRKPYLLAGIPFVILGFFFLFYPYNAPEETRRFGMVVASYLFFSTPCIRKLPSITTNAPVSVRCAFSSRRSPRSCARFCRCRLSSGLWMCVPAGW